jgi:hypothetical protein
LDSENFCYCDFKFFQRGGESWKIRAPRGAAALLLQCVAHVADASESEMRRTEMACDRMSYIDAV